MFIFQLICFEWYWGYFSFQKCSHYDGPIINRAIKVEWVNQNGDIRELVESAWTGFPPKKTNKNLSYDFLNDFFCWIFFHVSVSRFFYYFLIDSILLVWG